MIAGDQEIVIEDGVISAAFLHYDKTQFKIFDGVKFVEAGKMELVKKKAEVFKITLENGLTHKVTPCHQIKTKDGIKKCRDLKIGDFAAIQSKRSLPDQTLVCDLSDKIEDLIKTLSFFSFLANESADFRNTYQKRALSRIQLELLELGFSCKLHFRDACWRLDQDFDRPEFSAVASVEQVENQDVFGCDIISSEKLWTVNGFISHRSEGA